MGPSIACAKAGATTGEWADALRAVFGEYRAPTGVASAPSAGATSERFAEVRAAVGALTERLGRPPRILLGKPGLDGHTGGAEQIALAAQIFVIGLTLHLLCVKPC